MCRKGPSDSTTLRWRGGRGLDRRRWCRILSRSSDNGVRAILQAQLNIRQWLVHDHQKAQQQVQLVLSAMLQAVVRVVVLEGTKGSHY